MNFWGNKMEFIEISEKTKQWSIDRNLHTANPLKQFQKLNEEYGELNSGIAKDKPDVIKDSVGDCLVVLTILAQQLDIDDIDHLLLLGNSNYYTKGMASTDSLILYGSKSIGEMAATLQNITYNGSSINNIARIKFAIRNIAGVLDKIAINFGFVTKDCFEFAYNEIKDRKGKLIDGVWVKEADL